jgi:hypothetical protein
MTGEKATCLLFSVHTPNLIREMVECNPGGWAVRTPAQVLLQVLAGVASRAAELDDPQLNILMMRLSLYDVEPADRAARIAEQTRLIEPTNREEARP